MKKNSKKQLYESIMRGISKEVKCSLASLNESNASGNMNDILFGKAYFQSLNINDLLQDTYILKKIAGYIVEAQVKKVVKQQFSKNYQDTRGNHSGSAPSSDSTGIPRYVDGGNNWWDFTLDGEKVEIKAFQKGKMYSNVHATKNQVDNKNDLTFMLVEYKLMGNKITITGIAFVDGSEIEFDSRYNRLVKNSAINFRRDI